MSDRNQELLQHVIEHPDDDEARLVYADYLKGQGDPRGELIAVQVHLANRINPARRRQYRKMETEILREHGDTFMASAKDAGLRGVLRRGFIDQVFGKSKSFADNGAALIAKEPLQRVSLVSTIDKHVKTMIDEGLLGRVRSLRLGGGKLTDKTAKALAGSEQLASLRILNMSSNQITDEGLAALTESPHFKVESLTLNDNQITGAGLAALANAPASHSIQRLHLGRNGIDTEGVDALLASSHLTDLKVVGLSGNEDIGDAGVRAFADEALASRFELVELEMIDIERSTRTAIRELWGKRLAVDPW